MKTIKKECCNCCLLESEKLRIIELIHAAQKGELDYGRALFEIEILILRGGKQ